MKPITREEQYLYKLTGEETIIPEKPITREEQYLSRLCGKDNVIPQAPITRIEQYLAHLCGEEVAIPEKPITRLEQYMAFAAGEAETKPTPITRQEMLWDKYNGGFVPEEKTVDWTPVISVSDALAKPVVDYSIKITAKQEGTNPSPQNICPISGFTGANIHVNSYIITDTWQSEAGIVYGGVRNLTTGELTVTHIAKVYDGTEEGWRAISLGTGYYITISGSDYTRSELLKCSCLIGTNSSSSAGMPLNSIMLNGSKTNLLCRVDITTDFPSVDDWKAFLAQNPMTVIFPLAEPITYTLTPTEITLAEGANTIWSDTGDSKMTYLARAAENVRKMNATLAMNNAILKAGGKVTIEKPVLEPIDTKPILKK